MFNFKVPIYAGISGFILILITNILKGNTLFVILFRSFFYGALVFGIIFGIFFIFKKYLDINIETNGTSEVNDVEEKANVDIMVGEEELKDNFIENESDVPLDEEELKDFKNSIEETDKNEIDQIAENEIEEENIEKDTSIEDTDKNIEEISDEDKIVNIDDTNLINDTIKDDSIHELDELSIDENNFEEKNNIVVKDKKGSSLKSKIGIDVSYEDLAKAIRTKLKRDED